MDRGARAGLHLARRQLRPGQPLLHTHDDIVRRRVCTLKGPPLRKTVVGRPDAQLAHLHLPRALRRGLQRHQHPAQQQHRSRLEHPAQQLAVLRSRTAPHHLCGVSGAHQGGGHVSDQRRWRLRWNVCPLSVCRSVQRVSLCPYMEHTTAGPLCAREKLHPLGNGRRDGRRDARPADRHLPHRRDHQRLRPVHTANDRQHLFRDDNKRL